MNITIFGNGNMGQALNKNFTVMGNTVHHIGRENGIELGEIIVLAVPYPAVDDIISRYQEQLHDKIVIDITNPLNFETFDELVVPADGSAAQEIQKKLPQSHIVKGFNTNFSATLESGKVANKEQTTVLLASDSQKAKDTITKALETSPLAVVDVGSLKRARELEAVGFLQMTLAASEKISWYAGFSLLK